MNVWTFLADAAAKAPDRQCLRQGYRGLGYGAAMHAATRLAATLHARGVQPGARIGCLMHNDVDHFLAYFGVAAAGAVLVSLNTRLAAAEQRTILAHSGSVLLLHDAAHRERAAQLGESLANGAVLVADAVATGEQRGSPVALASADDPAQLYYTSGTTGTAKGVVLTHRNVCTHALTAARELGLSADDRWAHIAPMFHLADAWATFAITAVGGTHVFLPQFAPAAALELLAHERITITNLVPTMLNLMVNEPGAGERDYSLRTMLSGGAPIAPDVVRRILATFRCDYVQTYGMTETSPYLTLGLLTPELQHLPPAQQLRMKCKTGRPFAGIELRVVDERGALVPADDRTVGEIRVRGATVTPGYWQDPAATAAAFDRDGFLCTGDLATIDAHGYVDIVDRKKDVIKTGGESVYSVEVENVLHAHPAVLECAVFGQPDATWGERVTAAVVLRAGERATEGELIAHCRDRTTHFKAPREVRFVAALPRTGSGKIQKRLLRDGAAGGHDIPDR
ncbi:MAG TPA: AMP-binding protein [Planctomycetota bacterium]|nr:AMP-binding protein [Planctomycetota bacterium]